MLFILILLPLTSLHCFGACDSVYENVHNKICLKLTKIFLPDCVAVSGIQMVWVKLANCNENYGQQCWQQNYCFGQVRVSESLNDCELSWDRE